MSTAVAITIRERLPFGDNETPLSECRLNTCWIIELQVEGKWGLAGPDAPWKRYGKSTPSAFCSARRRTNALLISLFNVVLIGPNVWLVLWHPGAVKSSTNESPVRIKVLPRRSKRYTPTRSGGCVVNSVKIAESLVNRRRLLQSVPVYAVRAS